MVGIVVTCMQDKDQLCREKKKKKKKGPERRDSPSNEATTVHYTIEFPLILRERDTTANVLSIYTEKSHPSVHTSLLVSLSHYQLIARVIVFWPLLIIATSQQETKHQSPFSSPLPPLTSTKFYLYIIITIIDNQLSLFTILCIYPKVLRIKSHSP